MDYWGEEVMPPYASKSTSSSIDVSSLKLVKNESSPDRTPYAYTPPSVQDIDKLKSSGEKFTVKKSGGSSSGQVPYAYTPPSVQDIDKLKSSGEKFTTVVQKPHEVKSNNKVESNVQKGFVKEFEYGLKQKMKEDPYYASKFVVSGGVVQKGINLIPQAASAIYNPSIYKPGLVQQGVRAGEQIFSNLAPKAFAPIKGGATYLAQHPIQRGLIEILMPVVGADVGAGLAETVTTTPQTKLTKEQRNELYTGALEKGELLQEFTEEKSSKEINAKDEYVKQRNKELTDQGYSKAQATELINSEISPQMQFAPQGMIFQETGTNTYVSPPKEFTFKETGKSTMKIDDVSYKPSVPGINLPFVGYLSPLDLVPSKQVLPITGEKFKTDAYDYIKTEGEKLGLSPSEIKQEQEYWDVTQRQGRGYGGLIGSISGNVGEEVFTQTALKNTVSFTAKELVKGITKQEAAKRVGGASIVPLAVVGFAGGVTQSIGEQRQLNQDIDLFTTATSGIMGSFTSVGLGKPIIETSFTNPMLSKGIYGAASTLDVLEGFSDVAVTPKINKYLGVEDFSVPIITPVATKTTSSSSGAKTGTKESGVVMSPSTTPTPIPIATVLFTPTPETILTPTPGKTSVLTPNKAPTPIPIITVVPTPTPTPISTPTTTPTPTLVSTPTSTFVPTFTGRFMPFIPPIAGGGDWGTKSTKRERTRFIDEFSMAFSSLAKPSEPTYFGKQSSISKTRQMFKPKRKSKKPRGVNYQALFI